VSKSVKRQPKKKVGTGATIVYGIRLLILGVGLGAIVGTLLYISDPALRPGNNTPKVVTPATLGSTGSTSPSPALPSANSQLTPLKLQQEVPALQGQLEALIKARPNFQTGVFLQDLDNGNFVNILGDSPFAAASTIKLPILLAFFQDVDAGKINLSELLTLEKQFVAGGSGELQDQPLGTKYTALEVATRMMVGSDNTATNMLIARLGGIPVLNQRFQGWGLKNTTLQTVLPDLGGTNLTTPKELATTLAAVDQGELVSRRSRDLVLSIMQRTENDSLLPQGLEKNAAIAHKTGSLGELLADAGLIDMPNGKHYLLVVIVKRPRNDPRGVELIRQISRTVYTYFKQLPPSPKS
jgi:beta-lactamase class A